MSDRQELVAALVRILAALSRRVPDDSPELRALATAREILDFMNPPTPKPLEKATLAALRLGSTDGN